MFQENLKINMHVKIIILLLLRLENIVNKTYDDNNIKKTLKLGSVENCLKFFFVKMIFSFEKLLVNQKLL